MKKRVFAILVILTILLSSVSAFAVPNGNYPLEGVSVSATEKVTYEETLEVSAQGGTFQLGFAAITFKKNFVENVEWPLEIKVSIYAEDGIAYIELVPDMGNFKKKVKVKVKKFEGYLYDNATGENEWFELQNQTLQLSHFSRYAFS